MRIPAPPRRRANTLIITSLVDVMFVLLFFFMLTSSGLDWGVLPVHISPSGTRSAPATRPVLMLQLEPGGHLWLNGAEVAASALVTAIHRVAQARVVVQPAHGVPLQDLISVVDQLRAADVDVSLGAAVGTS